MEVTWLSDPFRLARLCYTTAMATGVSSFERILRLTRSTMSRDLARYLLALDFPASDHARYLRLSQKAQAGTLTPREKEQLDDLLAANDILMVFQAKARAALKRNNPAA